MARGKDVRKDVAMGFDDLEFTRRLSHQEKPSLRFDRSPDEEDDSRDVASLISCK